ncbi:hypothetical protein OEZ86_008092 [Tetradesmus obliquus]|nr:hypothetical protein OEZ86_008092 [Tetradesmus obliquus]
MGTQKGFTALILVAALAGALLDGPSAVSAQGLCLPGALSYIGCHIDRQGYLADVSYYSSSAEEQLAVCGSSTQQLSAAQLTALVRSVGEVIISLQVCGDAAGVRGLVFETSLSQTYSCGQTSGSCSRLAGDGAAALTGFSAVCGSVGTSLRVQGINSPCWNRMFEQPTSPSSCAPGFGTPGGGHPCRQCGAGEWGPGGGQPCMACPAGTLSLQPGAAGCTCLPGFGAVSFTKGECKRCQPGSFSPGGSTAPCSACPPGMTSVLGAVSAAFCVCKAGTGWDSSQCAECPAGSYSAGAEAPIRAPGSTRAEYPQCTDDVATCSAAGFTALTRSMFAAVTRAALSAPAGCIPCGDGFFTNGTGATSRDACVKMTATPPPPPPPPPSPPPAPPPPPPPPSPPPAPPPPLR